MSKVHVVKSSGFLGSGYMEHCLSLDAKMTVFGGFVLFFSFFSV